MTAAGAVGGGEGGGVSDVATRAGFRRRYHAGCDDETALECRTGGENGVVVVRQMTKRRTCTRRSVAAAAAAAVDAAASVSCSCS